MSKSPTKETWVASLLVAATPTGFLWLWVWTSKKKWAKQLKTGG